MYSRRNMEKERDILYDLKRKPIGRRDMKEKDKIKQGMSAFDFIYSWIHS